MIMTKSEINILSDRVCNYRIDSQLTQKQLAEKSGVSLRCIQRFESGEDIQLSNLIKILNGLELAQNIEMLVPDVTQRPSAFVLETKIKKRVRSGKSKIKDTGPFVWGDDK